MTNQSLRSLAISLAALGLVAGPAWSARVVEVRVGEHPTFTRVVFELDAKAGYEIERRTVEGGGEELVVTLSAASEPRKVGSRSPMVAGVEVEPSGRDAVARVRLRRSAPLVKELILGSPPRIVLDLMLPDELWRAAAAPKAKAKAKPEPATAQAPPEQRPEEPRELADATGAARPEASKPAPQAASPAPRAPAGASKATRPPEVVAAPEPTKPAQAAEAPKPPKPVETAAAPKAPESKAPETNVPPSGARGSEAPEKPEPALPAQARPLPPATPPTPTPGARIETALEGERVVTPKPTEPGEVETADAAPSKPLPPVARPGGTAPPKPVAKAPAASTPTAAKPGWGLFGLRLHGSDPWLTFALVGAGVLLFLVVVALLLRKHSRPTSLDALESAREAMGAGDSFDSEATSGAGEGLGVQREIFPRAGPGLFDDESEKGDMDMAAQIPVEREPRGRMTHTPAGADSDPGPLVRELERRMTQIESRLDQANEARERLERQVTAQSEELRVQRAAIARTQRALRGMSRGGEEATEPALRDPSKPPPGRP